MFKLIKIQLEIFASLQTLFPSLKIAIFWRIAPYDFPIPEKIVPMQTLFPPLKIAIFWRIAPLWSPHRGILCVEKISRSWAFGIEGLT